jgi:hypothetical protein
VVSRGSKQLSAWARIQQKYPEVKIYPYQNQGANLNLYLSIIRPHILRQHFERFPELKHKTLFYHDQDIIFNYLPDFETLSRDQINYQSDTSGYLDYNYLLNKEKQGNIPNNEAINKLAQIGGISPEVIEHYKGNTGGAQNLLKNIDAAFWGDVERICLDIS